MRCRFLVMALALVAVSAWVNTTAAAPVPPGAGQPPADPLGSAFLGVEIRTNDPIFGALVGVAYPNGAATRAGIAAGDRITQIAGADVAGHWELQRTLRCYRPGATVKVTILREGVTHVIPVRLGCQVPDTALGEPALPIGP